MLVFSPLAAMNHSTKPNFCHKKIYFDLLPKEVRNYLAQFIEFPDRETEPEFVRRTQQRETVSSDLYTPFRYTRLIIDFPGNDTVHVQYSPNKEKIILLEKLYDIHTSRIRIIDYKNSDIKEQVVLTEFSKTIGPAIAALSSSGTRYATIQSRWVPVPNIFLPDRTKKVLVINNIITGQSQEFDFPFFKEIKSIDFNKQETQVTIHGSKSNYSIVPLVTQEEHHEKSKKEFDVFLKRDNVRGKLPKSCYYACAIQ